MDLSVVAAVGSFMMSERVLRPKATVFFVMGCVFVYDLTSHTHDPTSLRCYRGPAMMSLAFFCCAYCLRICRRNGVAVDELLFLPGTKYGVKHGLLERHSECESTADVSLLLASGADGDFEEGEQNESEDSEH
eukprot:13078328-Ditylum_brightwellii.AAC.1